MPAAMLAWVNMTIDKNYMIIMTILQAVYDGFLDVRALLSKSSNWLCVLDKCTACRRLKHDHQARYDPTQQHTSAKTTTQCPQILSIFPVDFQEAFWQNSIQATYKPYFKN